MTDKQTGGPAFPIVGQWGVSEQGMTLRDYFAAKAMPECIGWGEPDEICAKAYEYADAMLKAREL